MNKTTNPWLTIPASDYEKHMALPEVAQSQALSSLMSSTLKEFAPTSLAVIGCATGNGFEHIDTVTAQRVVGVDINPDYLRILSSRFSDTISSLELHHADISKPEFSMKPVSMVLAALVFEYVDVHVALQNIKESILDYGTLVVVLQEPKPQFAPVTPTPFRSLERLSPIMNLIDPIAFSNLCKEKRLIEIGQDRIFLKSGKSFWVGSYRSFPKESCNP
ncbi:class I SAM-dependent methyltransferase [Pseudodesulfovibrio sp. zrk46]|uniref:class I SAM-dependent methyltransferase n=1 Tax=Pseudodesulfovibrio sp. zrk46 TaxID=2725288 RepID=UPI00144A06B5|nr:class I SAM-dependent methyltransferase [Pseudodesulfovibrio sp. zrk46]QJB56833.1 class I SAM-dependent methyltransferase [Pseudodesulfovibrio sp. zrk46]